MNYEEKVWWKPLGNMWMVKHNSCSQTYVNKISKCSLFWVSIWSSMERQWCLHLNLTVLHVCCAFSPCMTWSLSFWVRCAPMNTTSLSVSLSWGKAWSSPSKVSGWILFLYYMTRVSEVLCDCLKMLCQIIFCFLVNLRTSLLLLKNVTTLKKCFMSMCELTG